MSGMTTETETCECNECHEIHIEFIQAFGRWPNKTHEQGQVLKRSRIENEVSWQRLTTHAEQGKYDILVSITFTDCTNKFHIVK